MATFDQLLSTRGQLEGTKATWDRIQSDFIEDFTVEYTLIYQGHVMPKTVRNMNRTTGFDILAKILRDTDYNVTAKNVFPQEDEVTRKYTRVFTSIPYAGLDQSDYIAEITYIVSEASMFYKKMGLTTPQLVKVLQEALPFIDSTDSNNQHTYLKHILQLDKFPCPHCLELNAEDPNWIIQIMHISDDVCPKCLWDNDEAVHHVNRESFGEWKASSLVNWNKLDDYLDDRPGVLARIRAHKPLKPIKGQKVQLPADAGTNMCSITKNGASFYELTMLNREEK